MDADGTRSASKALLDLAPQVWSLSLPKLRSDEDVALPLVSAVPVLPKRRSYYVSSAERAESSRKDWGREGGTSDVRLGKKLRRVLWWQPAFEDQETNAGGVGNDISSGPCGVAMIRKVMTYARDLVGGLSLKFIDEK